MIGEFVLSIVGQNPVYATFFISMASAAVLALEIVLF